MRAVAHGGAQRPTSPASVPSWLPSGWPPVPFCPLASVCDDNKTTTITTTMPTTTEMAVASSQYKSSRVRGTCYLATCSHPPTACTERQQRSARWRRNQWQRSRARCPRAPLLLPHRRPCRRSRAHPHKWANPRTWARLRTQARLTLRSGRPGRPLWGSRPSKEALVRIALVRRSELSPMAGA